MTHHPSTRRRFAATLGLAPVALWLSAGQAFAHREQAHKSAADGKAPMREQKSWGIAADADQATRTVELQMSDGMRFTPDHIDVAEGETLRMRAINQGKLLHEIVLGTPEELDKHAALMKKFPGMQHDEPYMAHVPAGQRGEIVWTFNRPGDFAFACLLPGHFESGMRGTLRVQPKA